VKVHVRIADRRWDLLTINGVTIKLPEIAPEIALATLNEMQSNSDVLSRDVTAIDLRIADRATLTLGDTALAALFPPKDAEKVQ
jgi:cell division protein FtsQ